MEVVSVAFKVVSRFSAKDTKFVRYAGSSGPGSLSSDEVSEEAADDSSSASDEVVLLSSLLVDAGGGGRSGCAAFVPF